MSGSANPLVALGILLLVVGGIGLVYGQLTLQNQGNAGDGAFVTVDVSGDGGDNEDAQRLRTLRFGGLVLGGVGAVVTLTGGLLE